MLLEVLLLFGGMSVFKLLRQYSIRFLPFFFILLGGLFLCATSLVAQTAIPQTNDRYKELENQIRELESKLTETQTRGKTLTSEITYMDSQIKRTTLNMNLTEKKIDDLTVEIATLSGKINRLEVSLTQTSNVLIDRIIATYKQGSAPPLEILFGSENFGEFILKLKYIRTAQANDKMLMSQMQEAKVNYVEQKTTFEEKRKQQETLRDQLKKQKTQLDGQKAAKANLLSVTKNDEQKYQQLLAATRSEFESIQAIIAGKGDETEVGKVGEGAKIASIIGGASCNSSGSHLHFIVSQKGNTQNPFSYLRPGIAYDNCSGSSCGGGESDPFNPSGSWNWPISPKITMSQGYGSTWATRNTWIGSVYNFHNGIDINSDSASDVHAVKAGILHRGSYAGINGCKLRYVRVDHDDSDLETFYLHINY